MWARQIARLGMVIVLCSSFLVVVLGDELPTVVASKVLRLASLNICDGGGDRVSQIAEWLRDSRLDVVALQELNGWTEARLQEEAKAWDHPFVSLMETKLEGQHYNFGITSRRPLLVKEKRTQGFWHGLFHLVVDLVPNTLEDTEQLDAKLLQLHLLMTHLNPRSAKDRMKEIQTIVELVENVPLFVVMGDFNSLSPLDSLHYEEGHLVDVLRANPQLANKYLTPAGLIDYAPIETLSTIAHDLDYYSVRWDLDWFSPSVPSPLNSDFMHASPMRIDYVFASPQIFDHDIRTCGLVHTPVTDQLSDHYPVLCEFEFFFDDLS